MADYNDKLNEIFDIVPVSVLSETTESTQQNQPDTDNQIIPSNNTSLDKEVFEYDLKTEYDEVKKNYSTIIKHGLDAIREISDVAYQSQEPRAYEVLGQLIKSVTDTNEKRIMLQKQIRDMTKNTNESQSNGNTNIDKAIFIGSAADLNKLLKGKDLE